jgi:hypothetical protein
MKVGLVMRSGSSARPRAQAADRARLPRPEIADEADQLAASARRDRALAEASVSSGRRV